MTGKAKLVQMAWRRKGIATHPKTRGFPEIQVILRNRVAMKLENKSAFGIANGTAASGSQVDVEALKILDPL